MFGTSGIRGLYGKEVNEELALRIGNVFSNSDVVVGRDIRNTGESLENAVVSGVLSSGEKVFVAGIVPTPTLALVTKEKKCNGIMITASHNPSEYNGLKLFSNGMEISREQEKEITEKYQKGAQYCKWNNVGGKIEITNAIENHKKMIKNLVDLGLIKNKRPKIVVDSNGPGAVITPKLLEEFGCEVISINDSLNGFSRKSEPNEENLKDLCAIVKKEKADLGIAHDGDADRTVVVDENGEVLPLDVQLALMIEHELKNCKDEKKKIVSTVEASLAVREAVVALGGEIIITPVGSLYISEMIEKENAVFGGEPCGEYVFREGVLVPDGILSAAKFVELFCKKGAFSKLKEKYKTYFMKREKFSCVNSEKYKIVEQLKKDISFSGEKREDDGLRVDEKDGWFLIRASGTEPYIRLTMEYKDSGKLKERFEFLKGKIKGKI